MTRAGHTLVLFDEFRSHSCSKWQSPDLAISKFAQSPDFAISRSGNFQIWQSPDLRNLQICAISRSGNLQIWQSADLAISKSPPLGIAVFQLTFVAVHHKSMADHHWSVLATLRLLTSAGKSLGDSSLGVALGL